MIVCEYQLISHSSQTCGNVNGAALPCTASGSSEFEQVCSRAAVATLDCCLPANVTATHVKLSGPITSLPNVYVRQADIRRGGCHSVSQGQPIASEGLSEASQACKPREATKKVTGNCFLPCLFVTSGAMWSIDLTRETWACQPSSTGRRNNLFADICIDRSHVATVVGVHVATYTVVGD